MLGLFYVEMCVPVIKGSQLVKFCLFTSIYCIILFSHEIILVHMLKMFENVEFTCEELNFMHNVLFQHVEILIHLCINSQSQVNQRFQSKVHYAFFTSLYDVDLCSKTRNQLQRRHQFKPMRIEWVSPAHPAFKFLLGPQTLHCDDVTDFLIAFLSLRNV